MTEDTTILGLAVVAMAAAGIAPILAEIPTPLEQYSAGVPIHDIRCRDSMILMESPRGTPACVGEDSAQKMQQRGWATVLAEPRQIGGADVADAPAGRIIIRTVQDIVNKTALGSDIQHDRLVTANDPRSSGGSHGSLVLIPAPIVTYDVPRTFTVGQTETLNYTISWVDEDGLPIHDLSPDGVPEDRIQSYLDGVYTSIGLYATEDFDILTDGFTPFLVIDTGGNYYEVYSKSRPIKYNDTEPITGSMEIRLTKPLKAGISPFTVFLDDVSSRLDGKFAALPTDSGVEIVLETQAYDRTNGTDLHHGLGAVLIYDYENERWTDNSGSNTYPTGSDGLPVYAPPVEETTSRLASDSPGGQYLPRNAWKDFAEWLGNIKEYERITDYREWLLAEGMSEEFVADFFAAYPEFAVIDASFSDHATSKPRYNKTDQHVPF